MATTDTLAAPNLDALRSAMRGRVVTPDDADYDERRKVYNAMIDKRPAVIARCVDEADVMAAIGFARQAGLDVAIRGGGHNGGGLGTVDRGLVIDLSEMNGVRVDPAASVAVVQGGALLGDVDHATHAFGLALPGGIISTTGVAGLTLGGGIGHLTRAFGLTIDSLLEVDLVLADGRFVTASERQHEDLFWAVRGGGGNFGVVTSFTFRLHPVSDVVAGPTLWPLDRAAEAMRWYRDFLPKAPPSLNGFFAFLTVPPGPPFPEELHMQKMCGVVWCYTGPAEDADRVLRPVREFGPPALDGLMTMPLPALQSAFDGVYPPGDQWYWRADFMNELSDEAIARYVEHGSRLPTWKSTVHLYPIDGAAARPPNSDTPWAYRESRWAEVIVGVDPDPASADLIKSWTIESWEALHPHSAGGAYVNFMMDEGQDRVQATYKGNYGRLAAIKAEYDPTNFFHVNQNIRPAS
jgi:FAD/FMN-containing dehydrogenase